MGSMMEGLSVDLVMVVWGFSGGGWGLWRPLVGVRERSVMGSWAMVNIFEMSDWDLGAQ